MPAHFSTWFAWYAAGAILLIGAAVKLARVMGWW